MQLMKANPIRSASTLMDFEDPTNNFLKVEEEEEPIQSVLFARFEVEREQEPEKVLDAD